MSPARPPVSDSEREIMLVLWDLGPQAVRGVQEGLAARDFVWQRSTVITLLQRLEKKGYVQSDRSRHAYVFSAAISRDELVNQRLREVADELCDGASAPLLLAFAQQQPLSADELASLRRLVDELAARMRMTRGSDRSINRRGSSEHSRVVDSKWFDRGVPATGRVVIESPVSVATCLPALAVAAVADQVGFASVHRMAVLSRSVRSHCDCFGFGTSREGRHFSGSHRDATAESFDNKRQHEFFWRR